MKSGDGGSQRARGLGDQGNQTRIVRFADRRVQVEFADRIAKVGLADIVVIIAMG